MKALYDMIELLYETRHQDELDTVMPIIGPEGSGKSTLMLELAVKYCYHRDGELPTISHILDRIAYNRAQFQEMMANSDKQALIMAPDAGRLFYSMDVSTSEQKELEKDMMDVRGLEYMIMLGFQDFDRIGGQIDDRRAKLALKVPRRGLVRGYDRDDMDERIDEGSWPSSTLHDTFPPLDGTELWEEYQRVDEEKKRKRLSGEGNEDPEDVDKKVRREIAIKAYYGIGHFQYDVNYKEIASLIDYSDTWVNNTILDWEAGDYRDVVDMDEVVSA